MEPNELQSRRVHLGVLTLLFFLASLVVWWFEPGRQLIYGALLRVGTMLGAFWLAIPVMVRHPEILRRLPWYLIGGIIFVFAFIKYLWMMIPLLVLIGIMSMFAGKRPYDKRIDRRK